MTQVELAELSRFLFEPVSIGLLTVAMVAYLYAMSATRIPRPDGTVSMTGHRAEQAGFALAALGGLALAGHIVVRALAAERMPLGNMFEFSTIMALTTVVVGLVVVVGRLHRADLMGLLLLGAVLTMGAGLLVYTEPGPLQQVLGTAWRAIHVSAIVFAAGLFTVAFVFGAVYLLRDTAESRLRAPAAVRGGSLGAAHAADLSGGEELDTVEGRLWPDAVVGGDLDGLEAEALADYRAAMRGTISPWRLALGTFLGTAAVSWVFWVEGIRLGQAVTGAGFTRFLGVNVVMALAAVVAWWSVPFLPPAATLDAMAYRTIAFAFPIWTFGVILGAIWAEQSWGRYWGWDPKETSAFLTWVAYAGYLHARATRGMKGRNAGWLAILAFGVLMFTYYGVNLVISGLHSYA